MPAFWRITLCTDENGSTPISYKYFVCSTVDVDNGRPSDFHGAEWSKLINQVFVEPYHTHISASAMQQLMVLQVCSSSASWKYRRIEKNLDCYAELIQQLKVFDEWGQSCWRRLVLSHDFYSGILVLKIEQHRNFSLLPFSLCLYNQTKTVTR